MKKLALLGFAIAAYALVFSENINVCPSFNYDNACKDKKDKVDYCSHWDVYIGPHFNYVRLRFDNPSHLDGYAGGVTAGLGYDAQYFFSNLDFEGTWNASSITGDPNQKSCLSEYFIDWNVGPKYSMNEGLISFGIFTGFGWDLFFNIQDPNGVDLKYEYDKLFIPLGFVFNVIASNHFEWGLMGEWRPDVWSRVEVLDTKIDNSCKKAFRAQMPFKINFSNSYSGGFINIIPFYDWNQFGKATTTTPSGATLNISQLVRWYLGIRVLLGYAF